MQPVSRASSETISSCRDSRTSAALRKIPWRSRRRRLRPLGERGLGGGDRARRILAPACGDVGDRVAGERIAGLERVASGGVDPLAADELPALRGAGLRRAPAAAPSCPPSSAGPARPYQPVREGNTSSRLVGQRRRTCYGRRVVTASDSTRRNDVVAVARTRPRDPVGLRLRPLDDRRQRALARARPEQEHHASLHRDPDVAGLPAAGRGDEALPARPARPRPGLRGDQLDGHPRDLGPAPAGAQRRDRLHRQPGDPRRARRRLHRALPDVPIGAAPDRPQPARRLSPARVLHRPRQGAARVPPRGAVRGDPRPGRPRRPRARTRSPAAPLCAPRWSGSARWAWR